MPQNGTETHQDFVHTHTHTHILLPPPAEHHAPGGTWSRPSPAHKRRVCVCACGNKAVITRGSPGRDTCHKGASEPAGVGVIPHMASSRVRARRRRRRRVHGHTRAHTRLKACIPTPPYPPPLLLLLGRSVHRASSRSSSEIRG